MALSMRASSAGLVGFTRFVLTALAACGPTVAPRPPPSSVEITIAASEAPPPPPEAATAAPAAGPPDVEVLAAPAPAGCEISGKRRLSIVAEELPLCLSAEGPCFGHAAPREESTKITATFFEGDARAAGVHVTLDDGTFAARGIVKSAEVKLYPRIIFTIGSPTAVGDFIIPLSQVLEVERAARGVATAALSLGVGVALPGSVVRVERRCDELSLEPARFSVNDARRFVAGKAPPAATKGPSDTLPPNKDTPLSTSPGLPPIASLRPDDEASAEVDILERRGRATRIFWLRDGYAVYGWVPSGALRRTFGAGGLGLLNAIGTLSGPVGATTTCRAEIPLFVAVAGRRVEVGRLRKGGKLVPGSRQRGFVPVELTGGPVQLDAGAAWLVREADFDRHCAPP